MKKIVLIISFGIFLISSQVTFGQTIVGSGHDFSGQSWNTTSEICIICHIPHKAKTTVTNAPLWNHMITSVTNYSVYSSATMDAGALGQPDESSKLCLSCHDGSVALENFGSTTNGTTNYVLPANNFGTDLSNDHPISFVYDDALATKDGRLFPPTTTTSGIAGSTGHIDDDMLIGHKLQCASCHDVHNRYGVNHLLKKSNAASGLCLTCHNK